MSGLTQCSTGHGHRAYSLTQTQYGPEGIFKSPNAPAGRVPFAHKTPGDSAQTGGGTGNSFTVTQTSTQNTDTSSGQKNTIAGGITTTGTGTVNQNTLIQGTATTDVQDGTNTSVNSTINCPNGKSSCTKTLSTPKITQQPDDPSLYGSGKSFMFKNADPTVTFLCSLDGAAYAPCDNVTNPTITSPPYPPTTGYETTSGLESGKHTFSVETQDPANPSVNPPATSTITWWITPPDPVITSSAPPNPDFSGNSYTFKWTDTDNTVQYQCSIDGGTAASCSSGQTYSDLPAGPTTFTVTAYGANDSGFTHPDTTPPTVSWTILPLSISAFGSTGLTNDSAVGTDGSSAGWECKPGGPIALTAGSDPGTYGAISITDAGGAINAIAEPTFAATNYATGTPRYVIDLSDGNTLFGYPPSSGLNGSAMAWEEFTTNPGVYVPWGQVVAVEGTATVEDAYVVADASQPTPYTSEITNLTFNGMNYNPGTCP